MLLLYLRAQFIATKEEKMDIVYENKNVIVKGVEDFSLEQILECGQCFHFKKLGENEYNVIAMNKLLHIKQEKDVVTFYNTSMEEYEGIWKLYFDMDRDYSQIKSRILKVDDKLTTAIESKWGVRILNQDFFEILISFIISQNKQIPQIKQVVEHISKAYGEDVGGAYAFPTVDKLVQVSDEELRACKVGFRGPYIVDACKHVYSGNVTKEKLDKLDIQEARKLLMEIKGVGEKVANCVLLFGLGRREVFPVDVWMKRIMEELYLHKDTKKEDIEAYANEKYGELGGYAQQYLFYYGREMGIGK